MKTISGGTELMNTGIGRREIERDYDRILFAAPTRRLADKTQVFPMEKNDSIRTRLTHSYEVSNLARSFGVRLAFDQYARVFGKSAKGLSVKRTVPALLAAIGLAHDLGNPPFGHQGEKSIQRWFKDKRRKACALRSSNDDSYADFVGFDGNCQTFRLLTRLQVLNDHHGLNLTCATLAALMKYPVFSSTKKHPYRKFGVFLSERSIAEEVWRQTGLCEGTRHPLAYVMEACDDIAYSVIDAEDTVKKGYASFYDLIDYLNSGKGSNDNVLKEVVEASLEANDRFKGQSLSSSELNDLSMVMFRVKAIAKMVESATEAFVAHVSSILSGSIPSHFEVMDSSAAAMLCMKLKAFDRRYGFSNPAVLRLELEGHRYITETMDLLWEAIESREDTPWARYAYGRISENYRRVFEASNDGFAAKSHLLCDVLSGMSENYLVSLHDELSVLR